MQNPVDRKVVHGIANAQTTPLRTSVEDIVGTVGRSYGIAAPHSRQKPRGGYVPLDPELPPDRIAFMMADADLAVVLADDATRAALPGTRLPVVSVDDEWAAISGLDPGNLADPSVTPANVAYVIYTSGSTGQPKGVVLEHRQVVNFVHGMIEHLPIGPGDAVLQFAVPETNVVFAYGDYDENVSTFHMPNRPSAKHTIKWCDDGTIELDGHDITHLPMYRRARMGIGYLPQEASIFRGLTAEENIRATAELVETDPARLEAMVEELMAEFGVPHVRDTPAVALSGGERRRVEIARALATHPAYILLDEPLAGIDPIAVSEIRDLVIHLKDRGIGVLITDHNVRDALEIIDRAYIIQDGQMLKEGFPKDIVGDRGVRRGYLRERCSL